MNKPIGLNFGHPFALVIETQSQQRFPLPPFVAFQETPALCFPLPPFVAFQETPAPLVCRPNQLALLVFQHFNPPRAPGWPVRFLVEIRPSNLFPFFPFFPFAKLAARL
jgi:hypothetical protein